MQQAFENRGDLQAAAVGVRAAQSWLKAAHSDGVPSVNITADFGAAGTTPTHSTIGVYTVSGTVVIPIYEVL